MPGKYFSSKLSNPLIADDNFLLELTYAIRLCKGFKRLAYFRKIASVSGKPLSCENILWRYQFNIATPVSGQIKGT